MCPRVLTGRRAGRARKQVATVTVVLSRDGRVLPSQVRCLGVQLVVENDLLGERVGNPDGRHQKQGQQHELLGKRCGRIDFSDPGCGVDATHAGMLSSGANQFALERMGTIAQGLFEWKRPC